MWGLVTTAIWLLAVAAILTMVVRWQSFCSGGTGRPPMAIMSVAFSEATPQ